MVYSKNIKVLVLILIFFGIKLHAQETLYKAENFIKNQDTLRYRIMLPENFDTTKQYPIILFLHGAGERGKDNNKQLTHGSKLFADKMNRGAFPAIVIFPQCPQDDYWANVAVDRSTKPLTLSFPTEAPPTKALSLTMLLMEDFLSKPYANKQKVYVGGLSMGGMGTFEILHRKPDMFAAAISICGGGNPDGVKAYANKTELWVFHGAKDDVVDPQLSIQMVSAYLKAGGKPNFTLYANDNHNSWDAAFAEPQLLTWLFSKSKN